MIGLVMLIRARVRSEWGMQGNWQPKPRRALDPEHPWQWPLSRRYYELLDACSQSSERTDP